MKNVNAIVTLAVLLFVIFAFFSLKGLPPYGNDGKPKRQSEPTRPKNAGVLQTPR